MNIDFGSHPGVMLLAVLYAASLVCSPHSDSWVAIEMRSRPAVSWAVMRLFSLLMMR